MKLSILVILFGVRVSYATDTECKTFLIDNYCVAESQMADVTEAEARNLPAETRQKFAKYFSPEVRKSLGLENGERKIGSGTKPEVKPVEKEPEPVAPPAEKNEDIAPPSSVANEPPPRSSGGESRPAIQQAMPNYPPNYYGAAYTGTAGGPGTRHQNSLRELAGVPAVKIPEGPTEIRYLNTPEHREQVAENIALLKAKGLKPDEEKTVTELLEKFKENKIDARMVSLAVIPIVARQQQERLVAEMKGIDSPDADSNIEIDSNQGGEGSTNILNINISTEANANLKTDERISIEQKAVPGVEANSDEEDEGLNLAELLTPQGLWKSVSEAVNWVVGPDFSSDVLDLLRHLAGKGPAKRNSKRALASSASVDESLLGEGPYGVKISQQSSGKRIVGIVTLIALAILVTILLREKFRDQSLTISHWLRWLIPTRRRNEKKSS